MNQLSLEKFKTRKGASRRSNISKEILQALNEGQIETVNLVEWLAVDQVILLRNILLEIGWVHSIDSLCRKVSEMQNEGIMKRLQFIGECLFSSLESCGNSSSIYKIFASHPSDMVRAWAVFSITADRSLSIEQRLRCLYPFACDHNSSVRECTWFALRPYLIDDLENNFQLLLPWIKDQNTNIRRCAVEATRPCGVWCKHIPKLKEHPELGLVILEWVRSDSSDYVRRSVANWLNDSSKSSPNWVLQVCQRWKKESPTRETDWIIKQALRTLQKQKKFSL